METFRISGTRHGCSSSCIRRYVSGRMTSSTRYEPSHLGRVFLDWLVGIFWLAIIQEPRLGRMCFGLLCYDIGRLFVDRLPFLLSPILEPFLADPSSSLATLNYCLRGNLYPKRRSSSNEITTSVLKARLKGVSPVGILCVVR